MPSKKQTRSKPVVGYKPARVRAGDDLTQPPPNSGIPALGPNQVLCKVCGCPAEFVEVLKFRSTWHHANRNYPCVKRTQHVAA